MPDSIRITALNPANRDDFSCGNEALDRYIKQFAGQDIKRKIAVSYGAYKEKRLIGFYTLSAASIAAEELPEKLIKKLPKYPIPAILIGRLAIDISHQGKGLGSILLMDAIKRSIRGGELLGIFAILVDAKDEKAKSFYEHFGFTALEQNALRLFLPVQTALEVVSIEKTNGE